MAAPPPSINATGQFLFKMRRRRRAKIVCAICRVNIPNKEFMACSVCKLRFDLKCSAVSTKRFYMMNQEHKNDWQCFECRTNTPRYTGITDTEDFSTDSEAVVCEPKVSARDIIKQAMSEAVKLTTKRDTSVTRDEKKPVIGNCAMENICEKHAKEKEAKEKLAKENNLKEVTAVITNKLNDTPEQDSSHSSMCHSPELAVDYGRQIVFNHRKFIRQVMTEAAEKSSAEIATKDISKPADYLNEAMAKAVKETAKELADETRLKGRQKLQTQKDIENYIIEERLRARVMIKQATKELVTEQLKKINDHIESLHEYCSELIRKQNLADTKQYSDNSFSMDLPK